ncbi:MAG: RimK family protein [Balneolaceae bacterium]|nr:RimK family protein [Balneolaceae bacterium]MCH8548590.1 RimK family protein [Balneolaceae bacterium]
MRQIIVVNNPKRWNLDLQGAEIVSARDYLMKEEFGQYSKANICNLCKSYRYQSVGYYVSLLALARGHRPWPDVLAIQDLKSQTIIRLMSDELNQTIQQSLKPIQSSEFTLSIYFGQNLAKRHNRLARQLFTHFQAPLLRAEFTRKENDWTLKQINPIALNEVPKEHHPFIEEAATAFFNKPRPSVRKKDFRYDMAILTNPEEELPPSDEKAIAKFIKAANSAGFYTEMITREDATRINEFDALFIRETTSVNHHTYRISRRAEAEGVVVIDDPRSILLCTNKVYLAELLKKHRLPAPETIIFSNTVEELSRIEDQIGFPCIIKKPDSSFSHGVVKADNSEQLKELSSRMFQSSDLLIAQKFIPTEFDWRIGILDGKVLFGCRYFMARKHWQIYKHGGDGSLSEGIAETIPVTEIPPLIHETALKAAVLIGDGLYGVDLKELDGKPYVIEINDNPNIDQGVEDRVLNGELYDRIVASFRARIEKRKGGADGN